MIERNAKYKRIGKRLINKLPEFEELKESNVRIAFLSSDKEKITNRRRILADCRKVSDIYSWCCHYDFMITVYEPNIVTLNDKQLEILLIHELHHVGIDNEGEEPSFYIVPHDIEEFWSVIDAYGLHWQERTVD